MTRRERVLKELRRAPTWALHVALFIVLILVLGDPIVLERITNFAGVIVTLTGMAQ